MEHTFLITGSVLNNQNRRQATHCLLSEGRAYGGRRSSHDPQRPGRILRWRLGREVEDRNISRSRSASSFASITPAPWPEPEPGAKDHRRRWSPKRGTPPPCAPPCPTGGPQSGVTRACQPTESETGTSRQPPCPVRTASNGTQAHHGVS